jgi:hypothetical protein
MTEAQDLEGEALVDREGGLVIGIVIINVGSFACSPFALELLVFSSCTSYISGRLSVYALIITRSDILLVDALPSVI